MDKTVSASIWSIIERVGAQAAAFVIGIILARMLSPNDYGLIGITSIFITFSNIFIDCGFGNALIRKQNRTDVDLSTSFFFNLVIGIILYIILFIGAPIIAIYFEDELLISLVRIVGLTIICNSLCIVQVAVLTADLKIKEQTLINISSLIPSGLFAIWMAYKGYGVYALAVQSLCNAVIRTILLWVIAKWHPICACSKESISYLWGFGSRLLGANILGTFFNEIYTVIIGKYVNKYDLGLYSKGRSLSVQPESVCNGVVQKVGYPHLSRFQNDPILLKQKYKELTKMITCIMSLVSSLLIALASPIILLLWGEKWSGTIWIFQLLVLANLLSYVSYLTLVLLQVINKTSYTLKLEFIKKPVFLLIIFLSVRLNLPGLMWAQVIISLLATLVNMSAPQKYINYTYVEQFHDVASYMICAAVIIFFSLILDLIPVESNFIIIVMKAPLMVVVYTGLLLIMRDDITLHFVKLLRKRIKNICRN